MRTLKIADFCETGSGGTPSRARASEFYDNGVIPWVKSGELAFGEVNYTEEKITEAALANSSAKLIAPGSLLIAMYGATVGQVARLRIAAATNQAVCHIKPDENACSPEYLYWYLRSSKESLLKQRVGGAQPNISQGIIRDMKVPLPPLAEQERIAGILDKADGVRRKREEALKLSDELLRSVFLEMFGDPVTNPKGWPDRTSLGEVANLVSGITKGRSLAGKSAREVPYLAVANVQDRHLKLDSVKRIEATEEEIQRYKLRKDDLLLTEGGDPDKLGRGSLWREEISECIHQNHIFRIRLLNGDINPIFLSWLVGSSRGKRYFLRSAKQTTGIASINMTQLKAFPLLVPPISLQKEFSRIVAQVEQTSLKLKQGSIEVDKVFASLQQRAFSGKL